MKYRTLKDLTLEEGMKYLEEDVVGKLAILAGMTKEEYANLPASLNTLNVPSLTLPEPEDYPPEDISTQQWLDLQNTPVYEVLGYKPTDNFIEAYPHILGFTHALSSIMDDFSNIFSKEGGDGTKDTFTLAFGRLHMCIQVAKECNESLSAVLGYSLIQTLNIISYLQLNSIRIAKQYE